MRLAIVSVVLFSLYGCCSKPVFKEPKSESTVSKEEPQETFAQWIEEENAKKDKCDGLSSGSGTNGYDYWSEECVDGVRVFKDTTAEIWKWQAEEQKRKADLINAARTRVLTKKETADLLAYGPYIFTANMQQFRQEEIEKQFDELMLQQAKLKVCCERP